MVSDVWKSLSYVLNAERKRSGISLTSIPKSYVVCLSSRQNSAFKLLTLPYTLKVKQHLGHSFLVAYFSHESRSCCVSALLRSRPFNDELEAGDMALRLFLPPPFGWLVHLHFGIGVHFNNIPTLPSKSKISLSHAHNCSR